MRTPLSSLLALPLIGLVLAACGIHGNGDVVADDRDVTRFQSVEVHDAVEVNLIVAGPSDSRPEVTVITDSNLQEYIDVFVVEGELVVEITDDINPTRGVEVQVVMPRVEAIEVHDASRVDVDGISTENFRACVSDASRLTLDGVVRHLALSASDASRIDAEDLIADYAWVEASDASSVDVCVFTSLGVRASDASHVDYHCDPEEVSAETSDASRVD